MKGVRLSKDFAKATQRVVARSQHTAQNTPDAPRTPLSIPARRRWRGKADAAIAKGSTGTVSIHRADDPTTPLGEEPDTGDDLENCYARMGDVPAGAWVYVEEWEPGEDAHYGRLEVYQRECEVE